MKSQESRRFTSVTIILFLVAGIAIQAACRGTCCRSKGGAFERASRLMADNAACGGSDEAPCGGTALGIRACRGSAA